MQVLLQVSDALVIDLSHVVSSPGLLLKRGQMREIAASFSAWRAHYNLCKPDNRSSAQTASGRLHTFIG